MVKIVEMKDPYTSGHQEKVSEIAFAIAKELQDNKGILYDSDIVNACVKIIEEKQVKL